MVVLGNIKKEKNSHNEDFQKMVKLGKNAINDNFKKINDSNSILDYLTCNVTKNIKLHYFKKFSIETRYGNR
jgi:hypothetical protein